MSSTEYIRTPFAADGDTQEIPNNTQSDGSISWEQGWGPDYQRDLSNDPDAKAIERQNMNRLFYVLSAALKFWQERSFPEWIESDQNNGQAYGYDVGVTVSYVDGDGNKGFYVNQMANNTNAPTGAGWSRYIMRVASSAEVDSVTGIYPVTPAQAARIFDRRLKFPNATTAQRGIVQLSNSTDSTSTSLAATPSAVSNKLDHKKTALTTVNIGTLKNFGQRGIYYQPSATNATTANGYPVAAAGVLACLGQVNNALLQMYVTDSGRIFTRVAASNGDYAPWVEVSPAIPSANLSRAGTVQLSNALYGTSDSLAATESAVGGKLNYYKSRLNVDLNTLTKASDVGIYYQQSSSYATSANHYPITSAGILHVIGYVGGKPIQKYDSINGRTFIRYWNEANSEWNAWREISPAEVTATTSRAGIVQLSNALRGTSQTRAATELALAQKLTYSGGLGSKNLNDLDGAEDVGIYAQSTDREATPERNYPVKLAGTLIVAGNPNGKPAQTYIENRYGQIYSRRWDTEGTGWTTWEQAGQSTPTGAIMAFAKGGVPTGFLLCNGAAVSRSTYATLFARIGTAYGSGDGSSTFNLPNVPAGDALLSNNGVSNYAYTQNGMLLKHRHTITVAEGGAHSHTATTASAGVHKHSGSTASAGAHTHPISSTKEDDRGSGLINTISRQVRDLRRDINTGSAGAHTHTLSIADAGAHTHTVTVANGGAHKHSATCADAGNSSRAYAAGRSFMVCIKF